MLIAQDGNAIAIRRAKLIIIFLFIKKSCLFLFLALKTYVIDIQCAAWGSLIVGALGA